MSPGEPPAIFAAVPPMLKFVTGVVEATENGAVPVATVESNWLPERFPEAVTEVAVAAPRTGVMKVGVFANTNEPEPVSSDTTPAICAEVVAANWLNGKLVNASVPVAAGRLRVYVPDTFKVEIVVLPEVVPFIAKVELLNVFKAVTA